MKDQSLADAQVDVRVRKTQASPGFRMAPVRAAISVPSTAPAAMQASTAP